MKELYIKEFYLWQSEQYTIFSWDLLMNKQNELQNEDIFKRVIIKRKYSHTWERESCKQEIKNI